MPAASPLIGDVARAELATLGGLLRAHRKSLRISATAAAESAGISRVTLHRIERGEPSVTMGAYLSVIAALGMSLQVTQTGHRTDSQPTSSMPETSGIRVGDYPELRRISWQLAKSAVVTPREALNLYERNWRHVDHEAMEAREKELIQYLVDTHGGGVLLV
ncbi:helix-turn-helix transcriptional regulator [Nocardia sp. NPDC050717]|uniref:helix-turn-helix domain-containing protein n=1 Tax=Nocardia sp. NPDC050717 TaxID=3157221 RepID=UPI0033E24E45